MTRGKAIALGIFSFLPILYILSFIGLFFILMLSFVLGNDGEPSYMQYIFPVMFVLHISFMLLAWVLIAIYIINVFKNDLVDKDKKALWAVVLFLGNIFAMPIYWYLYIWKPLKESSVAV